MFIEDYVKLVDGNKAAACRSVCSIVLDLPSLL